MSRNKRVLPPDEPSGEDCEWNKTFEWNGLKAMACWYPQMGGYVGKCVVVDESPADPGGCFGVFIWHDGEFPFTIDSENGNQPYYLHHCAAEQFIAFGELVNKFQGVEDEEDE